MQPGVFRKLFTSDWHFLGVIIFFVVHGFVTYPGLIPVGDALVFWVIATVATLLSFWINLKLLPRKRNAALFTSCLAITVLFFGVFQDAMAGWRPVAGMARLYVYLPVCCVLVIMAFVFLKRTRLPLNKPVVFLNILLACYLLADLVQLTARAIVPDTSRRNVAAWHGIDRCDTCAKPSVYLVLLDEYMGSEGLQRYLQYNNSSFEDSLRNKGFHVVGQPHSNYLLTAYSMASMLNMRFLPDHGEVSIENHYLYKESLGSIKNNLVCTVFADAGYRVVNYSPFDLRTAPAGYATGLLADKMSLLTSQAAWRRIGAGLPHLLEKMKWGKGMLRDMDDRLVKDNERMMQQAIAGCRKDTVPGFYYLHLTMPHAPYALDSTGKRIQPRGTDAEYLSYLKYTNQRILAFVQQLQACSGREAVILLMSDHGLRTALRTQLASGYSTLNAVYLPNGQYAGWYDGMSNVNQFRVLLNTLFHQHQPMLKDSMIY